jgi:formamidopyrimidine-DNA glycosylase
MGGEWLVVSDPRSWATFTLDPPADPAPDALDAACDEAYLRDRLRERTDLCVKEFLVDQRLVRGIGNAYSDEILWACRIAPRSRCDRLPEEKIGELHAAIRLVLEDGIAQLGRLDPDAIHGERRDFLKVHRPDRTHSPTGYPIHCERIGTRKTYWTDEQIVYG